jgi:DNA processing protein
VIEKREKQDVDEWIRVSLVAVPGIGRKTILAVHHWLKQHQLTWGEWWKDSRQWSRILSEGQQEQLKIFQKKHTPSTYVESLRERQISWVFVGSPEYPRTLAQIPDAPLLLFYKGDWSHIQFDSLMVGVVGSREMTGYGEQVTRKIVSELVPLGVTIISGAMYGVDTEAQVSCLENGGMSVGVLGYGFDHCYPPEQAPVLEKLLAGGHVLVSEFAPEVAPKSQLFPVRNRIIAGWSEVLVVTEAAEKSGSLITANAALEYGRTVCAVPGSIKYPTTAGTRWLLNQGAVLVASGVDVWREARGGVDFPQEAKLSMEFDEGAESEGFSTPPPRCSPEAQRIWSILTQSASTTSELQEMLGWEIPTLLAAITELEINNLAKMRGETWEVVH